VTNDKVQILTGFVFSPSAIALAPVVTQAKVPMVIANAGTAWITNLSPYIARLSFSMWHHAYPMGAFAFSKVGCKTAALAYTDFPPGKDSTEAFKTGFEKAGGKVTEGNPDGQPGAGAGFHAVLPAHQGRQARLHVCVHSVRRARDRRGEGLWRTRHA
jgi:branched-chain amino acid transport system substrate-binding protein